MSAVKSNKTATKKRQVPRGFEMHWGSGQIVEEASWTGPHHEPTIQLMRYDDGEAAGSVTVRFCSYNHGGQFQRSPLMVDQEAIAGLREALKNTPELRKILRALVR
jgi:hypothetical protein